jgi:hypothetical protein
MIRSTSKSSQSSRADPAQQPAGPKYRVVRQNLPLSWEDAPRLAGVENPGQPAPPATDEEAHLVGAAAAEDGLQLRELLEDCLRKWPGSIYTLPSLMAAGVLGWFQRQGKQHDASRADNDGS